MTTDTAKWISMKRRKPKGDGRALVFAPSCDPKKPFVAMAWWTDGEGWLHIPGVWADAITYWRPLPDPPRRKRPKSWLT